MSKEIYKEIQEEIEDLTNNINEEVAGLDDDLETLEGDDVTLPEIEQPQQPIIEQPEVEQPVAEQEAPEIEQPHQLDKEQTHHLQYFAVEFEHPKEHSHHESHNKVPNRTWRLCTRTLPMEFLCILLSYLNISCI